MFQTKEVSEDITSYNSSKTNFVLTRNNFSKSERLHEDIFIASLFSAGQTFFITPFKVYFLQYNKANLNAPIKILISVPKKHFSSAVDRNKIKRQIREAYRKNKHPLYQVIKHKKNSLALAFIYTSQKITTFNEVENKIKITLSRLLHEVEKHA